MNTQEFLTAILPRQGHYISAELRTKGEQRFWIHKVFQSVDDLAAHVASNGHKGAMYHACASYNDDAYDRFVVGDKGVRTQHNALWCRSFWMDIDVRDDGKSYATLMDAAAAAREFCQRIGLPKPLAVDSGGGLHLYWPMTEDVPVDQWRTYAGKLKGLAIACGFKADPTRTADQASVLRPVGTLNTKYDTPRPVRALTQPVFYPPKQLMAALALAAENFNVPDEPVAKPAALAIAGVSPVSRDNELAKEVINAQLAAAKELAGHIEANPKRMCERCAQLRWHAVTGGAMATEPEWYDMIGAMLFAVRGEDAIHLLSRKHPAYSEDNTNAKIAQRVNANMGPTTCQQFRTTRPEGCAGCPHLGRIKTPVLLGRESSQAPAPLVETRDDDTGAQRLAKLPDPPQPFRRVLKDGEIKVAMMVELEKGAGTEEVIILNYDLYPLRRERSVKDNKFSLVMRADMPNDGAQDIRIDCGVLLGDARGTKVALGNAGVACSLENTDHLRNYMIAYMEQLQRRARAETVYAQCGFTEDYTEFVLPDRVVTANEVKAIGANNTLRAALPKWKAPAGTLEGWKQAVEFFNRPGREVMQAALLVGLASPLYHMIGIAGGGQFNVFGRAGTGKSLGLRAACSVWSAPDSTWVVLRDNDSMSPGDTPKSFYNTLGKLRHIMAAFDECSCLSQRLIGDMQYQLTNGKGRSRLGQDGEAREGHNDFQLLLNTTSNDSLHAKFQIDNDVAHAQAVRLFEVKLEHAIPKEEGAQVAELLRENNGHAAVPFLQYVLRDVRGVSDRLRAWVAHYDKQLNITGHDRFWSSYSAALTLVLEIARELGLVNYDLNAFVLWNLREIRRMQATINDGTTTAEYLLDEFMRTHAANTLIVDSNAGNTIVRRENMASHALRIRVDLHDKKVYIDQGYLRNWFVERGVAVDEQRASLRAAGVLLNSGVRVSLGKGCPGVGTMQTRCWVLDMEHTAFSFSESTGGDSNVVPMKRA